MGVIYREFGGGGTSATPDLSFSPKFGKVGDPLTITVTNGGNLTGTTSLTFFNAVSQSTFTETSAIQMTTTIPAGAATGPIELITPSVAIISTSDFVVSDPAISSFTGSAGEGQAVEINYSGFDSEPTQVTFSNGVAASFTVTTAGSIGEAISPPGFVTGPLILRNAIEEVTTATDLTRLELVTDIRFTILTSQGGTNIQTRELEAYSTIGDSTSLLVGGTGVSSAPSSSGSATDFPEAINGVTQTSFTDFWAVNLTEVPYSLTVTLPTPNVVVEVGVFGPGNIGANTSIQDFTVELSTDNQLTWSAPETFTVPSAASYNAGAGTGSVIPVRFALA